MRERDEILDWVRGGSAFMVLAAHARGFLFPDLGDLVNPGVGVKVFYFFTGLHQEAVMVFFVLSGYFVGGAVLKSAGAGTFGWKTYAAARTTRLWMVLLPALVLTLMCDRVGIYFAPEAYAGGFHDKWLSGPSPLEHGDYSARALVGNAVFLQTISVPVYGSNGPLWSLAYEFWYYVLFPLVVVAGLKAGRRETWGTLLYLLALSGLIFWLPKGLLASGGIWLMGVGVAILRHQYGRPNFGSPVRVALTTLGAILFLGALAATKLYSGPEIDYVVGGVFALWMVVLPNRQPNLRFLEPVGKFLAAISFTLYVSHFPLLFFLSAVIFEGHQFTSIGAGAAAYFACLLAALILATLFWWAFESRTERVRRAVSGER